MKKYIFLLVTILTTNVAFSQVDTTTVTTTVVAFDVLTLLSNLPNWFYTAVIITGATLSATQTILKQFPTERSVKLTGIIGKILDFLTFFADDNKKGGGTH